MTFNITAADHLEAGGLMAELLPRIPELSQGFDPRDAQQRMAAAGLLLVAHQDGQLIGFKAGYDRFRDGSFYSWLGGVVPAARGSGVAQQLLEAQEKMVAQAGYKRIYVKTRNRFVGMRIVLARNGYQVCGFTGAAAGLSEARLMHVKDLA